MKGENVNEKTEVQLERIPPAEVAWFALGSCARVSGRDAGAVFLLAHCGRMWVAVEILRDRALWAREIGPGHSPEAAAGAVVGGIPTAEALAVLGFESIGGETLAEIRAARAAGFRARPKFYDLTIYGRRTGKKWTRARIERAIQKVPEGERRHFGFVELCDKSHWKS